MKEGDCCDIVEILSTAERDFLVRNNGDQVKIESLRGKTICVYFLYSIRVGEDQDLYMNLAEVYNELSPKGEFEVVVVPARGVFSPENKERKIYLTKKRKRKINYKELFKNIINRKIDLTKKRKRKIEYKELFKNIFSAMPWLSIPYRDVKTRKHLCNLFSMPPFWGSSDCVILDPDGKVVSESGSEILEDFGAEGYPFTAERIKEIEKEDELLRGNLCLKTLLGSFTSDFVITNQGDEVPISQLKGKVVGLYMYHCHPGTKKNLVAAYKELKREDKDFEIVLVNLHFNGGCSDINSFWQNFEKMPWLALPFMDKRCRKLWRIFDYPCVGNSDGGILLIFGPDGNFVETYGYTILEEYGIEAYPFTKEKVLEIEMNIRKEVTLDRLFAKATKDYVIKNDGTKILISDLKGKNILIFSPHRNGKDSCEVLPKLKEWYFEIQRKDETFEIIYASSTGSSPRSFNDLFFEMPWLAFPWETDMRYKFYDIIGGYTSELAAFGSDGHLVTINALSRLQDHGVDAYPFVEDDIPKEIFEELELMPCMV